MFRFSICRKAHAELIRRQMGRESLYYSPNRVGRMLVRVTVNQEVDSQAKASKR